MYATLSPYKYNYSWVHGGTLILQPVEAIFLAPGLIFFVLDLYVEVVFKRLLPLGKRGPTAWPETGFLRLIFASSIALFKTYLREAGL